MPVTVRLHFVWKKVGGRAENKTTALCFEWQVAFDETNGNPNFFSDCHFLRLYMENRMKRIIFATYI